MKHILSIFILFFMMLGSYQTEGQIMRRLRNAAEQGVARAVEKRVEREVEKATQRQLEKAFGNLYGDPAGSPRGSGYDFSKILGSINMDVETESTYDFTGLAVMEITGTEANGKAINPVHIHSFLSAENNYYGMEFIDEENAKNQEKTVMIFDHKNNATIMLLESKEGRSSIAFSLDWNTLMEMENTDGATGEEQEVVDLNDYKFEKTGNTKSILGYTCDEYQVSGEEFEGIYWVSQDPIDGLESFWGKNSPFITQKMKNENQIYFDNLPEGNMLEMHFTSKEDQSSSLIKFTEIDKNKNNSFSMEDYPNVMQAR